jgi:hypothetical protein
VIELRFLVAWFVVSLMFGMAVGRVFAVAGRDQ